MDASAQKISAPLIASYEMLFPVDPGIPVFQYADDDDDEEEEDGVYFDYGEDDDEED